MPVRWTQHLAGLVAVAASATALAYVVPATLDELLKAAEAVVIARVDGVATIEDIRIASATVESVIRGDTSLRVVHFVAQPTWNCDVSDAVQSERVLLFLSAATPGRDPRIFLPVPHTVSGHPVFLISWSGRGRMPIIERSGKQIVTFQDDVLLPNSVRTIAAPDPKAEFSRSALLEDLIGHIRRSPSKSPARPGAGV